MNSIQKTIFDAYNASGRLAFYHPKKEKISLNGGRSMATAEAVKRMSNAMERDRMIRLYQGKTD